MELAFVERAINFFVNVFHNRENFFGEALDRDVEADCIRAEIAFGEEGVEVEDAFDFFCDEQTLQEDKTFFGGEAVENFLRKSFSGKDL